MTEHTTNVVALPARPKRRRVAVKAATGVFKDGPRGAAFAESVPHPAMGQCLVWDAHPDHAGFGICVGTAARTWVIKHRWRDADGAARVRQFTIGRAGPGGLTLAEARAKAVEWKRWWIEHPGDDPREAERAERRRAGLTLGAALDAYTADRVEAGRSPRSMVSYRRGFELYAPDWLGRPLKSLTPAEVLLRYRAIRDGSGLGKRADGGKFAGGRTKLRGGERSAKITMAGLKAVHRWARRRLDATLGDPPTGAIDGLSAVSRSDRVVPPSALPAVAAAAAKWPNGVQGDLFAFLLYTGLRLGEASALRWDETDLDAGTVTIAAGRMKARRKLSIPLGATALATLAGRRAIGLDASGFVFVGACRGCPACGNRGGHARLSKKLLASLTAAAGTPFSAHDVRRTFTSAALDAGVALHVVEALTAHRHSGVTLGHYYQPSPAALRDAVARIDAELAARCRQAPGAGG